ncbi:conserved hypothetical protein [Ricinus communis]|uniref:Zinc finger GRF-type domain-containing protein n=1 Tax=Ricinus communis TaxID=3988 RepID=B9SHI3_RICCO|nr:conserved hypothetical protein [Ricinus communis]
MWTAWKESHPGRRFFGCSKYDKRHRGVGCEFFLWIDLPMCERAKAVINDLNQEKEALWKENCQMMNIGKKNAQNFS